MFCNPRVAARNNNNNNTTNMKREPSTCWKERRLESRCYDETLYRGTFASIPPKHLCIERVGGVCSRTPRSHRTLERRDLLAELRDDATKMVQTVHVPDTDRERQIRRASDADPQFPGD
ncbi:unnamed protein product [Pleuronectes platessa]|uniref:Uncharacterized protein n=1 Tax=Pleuronectes platessa TaxID=8262 RepID=A0A9N7YZG3_PLEPL|nr:unnamed protein product [Pleuronectes platessa]